MRKLLILTALAMLTASSAGCRWCERWWRGSYADPCPPVAAPVYGVPSYNPPDPCSCGGAPAGMPIGPG